MEILRTDEVGVQEAAEKAASALIAGEIVLYPTDTLYGLAVDARNAHAVERLITLKGRGMDKFFSVALLDAAMIDQYAEVSREAQKLIDTHLPGPLTLVLPIKGMELSHLASDGAIGIRVPDDRFTDALSRAFKGPYTATSANVSGQQAMPIVSEILAQFGSLADHIGLAVDDGPRAGGTPSTVVCIIGARLEILREGALSRADLGLIPQVLPLPHARS